MNTKYEQPLGVQIINGLGVLCMVGGAIYFIMSAMGGNNVGEVEGLAAIVGAVFDFMFAAIWDAAARTAFYAERTADNAARTAYYAERTAELLEKMDPLRAPSPLPSPLPGALHGVAETLKPAADRFFVKKPGGEQQGPLGVADLQKLLNAGVVTASTPVFRERDEEWKTLEAFISTL